MLSSDTSCEAGVGRTLVVDGGREIVFRDWGQGLAVVLVHGIPGSLEVWGELPESLARRFRTITYARVGYRPSLATRGPEDHSIARQIRDLHLLLKGLHIDRAVLIGWSFGAAIVQAFGSRYPERVFGNILIAPVAAACSGRRPGVLERCARTALGFRLISAAMHRRWIALPLIRAELRRLFYPSMVPAAWINMVWSIYSNPRALRTIIRERACSDAVPRGNEPINVPTLILHGSEDQIAPIEASNEMQRKATNSRLVIIFAEGHAVHISAGTRVLREINEFIAGLGAGRTTQSRQARGAATRLP